MQKELIKSTRREVQRVCDTLMLPSNLPLFRGLAGWVLLGATYVGCCVTVSNPTG